MTWLGHPVLMLLSFIIIDGTSYIVGLFIEFYMTALLTNHGKKTGSPEFNGQSRSM